MVEHVRVEQEKAEQESTRERQRRFPARRCRLARQSHIVCVWCVFNDRYGCDDDFDESVVFQFWNFFQNFFLFFLIF